MKRLLRSPRVQEAGAATLAAYLRFALRTTRWTVEGQDHLAPFLAGAPAVVAFWHDRLPAITAMWQRAARDGGRQGARMHVMVSRHRDGQLIARVVGRFGVRVVHGSTAKAGADRGGRAAIRAMLALLAEGHQVGITPDGPRGPARQAQPGVAQIAALAGVPVVPVSAATSRRRLLPSWDRMQLPLPFSHGVLVCGAPITVPRQDWAASLPAIAAALDAAADRADLLCR